MSRSDWLKLLVLILLPINAWFGVLYYQKWRWSQMYGEWFRREDEVRGMLLKYLGERWGLREGVPLRLPPLKQVIGKFPPLGQGVPVLFIYISWCAEPEVWEPAVEEALKYDPSLHIALLHDFPTTSKNAQIVVDTERLPLARKLWERFTEQFKTDRISVLTSLEWGKVWGDMRVGTLAVVCDGRGIIRVIEPYPPLLFSAFWHVEVKDWRPKLRQAVKRALDKFYGKYEK